MEELPEFIITIFIKHIIKIKILKHLKTIFLIIKYFNI
jgi:hypothetical protein